VFRLPDRFVFLFSMGWPFSRASDSIGCSRAVARNGGTRRRPTGPRDHWRILRARRDGGGDQVLRDGVRAASAPWGWFTFYGFGLEHFGGLGWAAAYAAGASLIIAACVAAVGITGFGW